MNDHRYSNLILFEPVQDVYGSRLAIVFGNEFADGKCPFYLAKQCNHCDIGAGEGWQFDTVSNKSRLEFFKTHYGNDIKDIEHLIIYNSGSVLNRKEISLETLDIILGFVSELKKCKIISFDSREQFITKENLDYIISKLRNDQQVRVVLGVESQDDKVRMINLNKNMSKESIEKAFRILEEYHGKVGMDFNILFQPPEYVGEKAIDESVKTLKYGLQLSKWYNVPVDFNFHPYYPSRKSSLLYPNHPRAKFEDAKKALEEMSLEISLSKLRSNIFIGWQDEGHDIEQKVRRQELIKQIRLFNKFNLLQSF